LDFVEQIENKLTEGLKEALCRVLAQNSVALNELPSFIVEVPRDPSHGDFASNAALLLAGKIKNNPRELAQAIAQNFPSLEEVERIEVAGPGFINFRLKSFWLDGVVPNILTEKENYGRSDIGRRKKVQVEFVSANPTGLLHMGNARGAALGDTIASLLETTGFAVTREFYINDAGNQIELFADSLEARYLQLTGHDVPFPEDGYAGKDVINTVKHIILKYDIGLICFIPPTIDRKVQFLDVLKSSLNLKMDELIATKVVGSTRIPQKTLRKLEDRIINAKETIAVDPRKKIESNVLIIDDADSKIKKSNRSLFESGFNDNIKKCCL